MVIIIKKQKRAFKLKNNCLNITISLVIWITRLKKFKKIVNETIFASKRYIY